jgi:hypothetical protein
VPCLLCFLSLVCSVDYCFPVTFFICIDEDAEGYVGVALWVSEWGDFVDLVLISSLYWD